MLVKLTRNNMLETSKTSEFVSWLFTVCLDFVLGPLHYFYTPKMILYSSHLELWMLLKASPNYGKQERKMKNQSEVG